MQRILLVKTTSLGDVIHCLPAASDIARLYPEAAIDWVVEETYVDVVRLHPAIARVLPVAVRRWRRSLRARQTRDEFAAFRQQLAQAQYDRVIDVQGLAKSAFLARLATGERHGLDRASAREWIAALTYHRRHHVPWTLGAVARNRQLVGDALGYAPQGAPDFGIAAAPARFDWLPASRYCVCLTGTTDVAKLWPEERWGELGRDLAAAGWRCVFPAGTDGERARAGRIAAAVDASGAAAVVAPAASLGELAGVLAGADLAIGVDTGLTHLAAALGRPTVGIYCGTSPRATGVIGTRVCNVGDVAKTPTSAAVRDAAASLAEIAAPVCP
ncbi:MAG: lipopolysaccharide heptosyltransferase I [Burkholderiales bacterium]|nr:lipopolysaccharide heptosyltransferase I [Burkholderiales bacterium]